MDNRSILDFESLFVNLEQKRGDLVAHLKGCVLDTYVARPIDLPPKLPAGPRR